MRTIRARPDAIERQRVAAPSSPGWPSLRRCRCILWPQRAWRLRLPSEQRHCEVQSDWRPRGMTRPPPGDWGLAFAARPIARPIPTYGPSCELFAVSFAWICCPGASRAVAWRSGAAPGHGDMKSPCRVFCGGPHAGPWVIHASFDRPDVDARSHARIGRICGASAPSL